MGWRNAASAPTAAPGPWIYEDWDQGEACEHPYCGSERVLVRCPGCSECFYCSAECQETDWPRHRRECDWEPVPYVDLESDFPLESDALYRDSESASDSDFKLPTPQRVAVSLFESPLKRGPQAAKPVAVAKGSRGRGRSGKRRRKSGPSVRR